MTAAVLASGSAAATPMLGITNPPADPEPSDGAIEALGGIAKPAASDGGVETPGVFSTVADGGVAAGLAASEGAAAAGSAKPGAAAGVAVGGAVAVGVVAACAVAWGVVENALCEPGKG